MTEYEENIVRPDDTSPVDTGAFHQKVMQAENGGPAPDTEKYGIKIPRAFDPADQYEPGDSDRPDGNRAEWKAFDIGLNPIVIVALDHDKRLLTGGNPFLGNRPNPEDLIALALFILDRSVKPEPIVYPESLVKSFLTKEKAEEFLSQVSSNLDEAMASPEPAQRRTIRHPEDGLEPHVKWTGPKVHDNPQA